MKFLGLIAVLIITGLIASCGGAKHEGLDKYVGHYLNDNSEAIIVMRMDVSSIMEKSDLKSLPDIGFELLGTFNKIDTSMALDEKIYIIASGPLNYEGMPENTALFISVKNKEAAARMFNEMGYFFEVDKGINIHDEDGLAIGFTEDLVIVGLTSSKTDAKTFVLSAFEKAKKGGVNEVAMKNISYDGDIVVSLNLQNLYGTSNTDLNKLPIQQQEKIKKMAKNSFVNTALSFNTGEIVVETHLEFNEDLQKAMFFDESGNADILAKLGPGKPIAAFSIHLDLDKMESFMMDVYPEGMKDMYKNLGPQGLILKALGGGKLSNFVNGEFALAITGFSEMMVFAIPQVNIYSGLGASSGDFSDLLIALLEEQDAEQLGEGIFEYEGMKVKFTSSSIFATSEASLTNQQLGNSPMEVPAGITGFGQKPFTFYIDFTMLKSEEAEMMTGNADVVIQELEYIYFEADNKKAKLIIKTTDGSMNVLKKSVDTALEAIL
jgi:hypothetical protein